MENLQKKALFFDIDGTLVGKRGFVPDSTMRALFRARELGNLVFINTGRTYKLALCAAKRFETDGLLCGCGTEVTIGGRSLYEYIVPSKRVEDLKRDCRLMAFDLCLEGHDGVGYSENLRTPEAKRLADFTDREGALFKDGFDHEFEVNKFCIQADKKTDLGAFKEEYSTDFDIIDRGGGFFECVPKGHSKATAIEYVLKHFDIPADRAYAFGDSTNDISMLKAVPHAVIMGDHDKETEKYADFITKRLEDDGIEYAMKSLKII